MEKERMLLDIPNHYIFSEMYKRLKISKASFCRLIKNNNIASVKIGKYKYYNYSECKRLLYRQNNIIPFIFYRVKDWYDRENRDLYRQQSIIKDYLYDRKYNVSNIQYKILYGDCIDKSDKNYIILTQLLEKRTFNYIYISNFNILCSMEWTEGLYSLLNTYKCKIDIVDDSRAFTFYDENVVLSNRFSHNGCKL